MCRAYVNLFNKPLIKFFLILLTAGTFSSTQRKCTDKQNLLFSTLAPGTDFVFSTKILYTWPQKKKGTVKIDIYIYICVCVVCVTVCCQNNWNIGDSTSWKLLNIKNRTSLIIGRNSLAGWKSTPSLLPWKKTWNYENKHKD